MLKSMKILLRYEADDPEIHEFILKTIKMLIKSEVEVLILDTREPPQSQPSL